MKAQKYLEVIQAIKNFNIQELQEFLMEIIETIDIKSKFNKPNTNIGELQVNIHYCKHCGSVNVVKNGHTKKGKQNFRCNDCHKSFNSTSNTILDSTKKPLSIWNKYIECEIFHLSLRETAKILNISTNTVFTMRHKFLKAMSEYSKTVKLSGKIQIDPTYTKINLKGTKPNKMPRESKKRASSNARGLSREQVCIMSGTDEFDNTVFKITGLGKEGIDDYVKLLPNIFKPTLIITDSAPGYNKFAIDNKLTIDQIPSMKHVSKHGNSLGSINQIHSGVKEFLRKYHGVSIRHLQGYLDLFSILRMFGFKFEHKEKKDKIFNTSLITDSKITAKKIFKKVIPVDLSKIYGNKGILLMTY